jgi:hypothetical protein
MSLEAAAAGSSSSSTALKGVEGSNAWRGAEAYHFWLLAHQQLYGGQVSVGGPCSSMQGAHNATDEQRARICPSSSAPHASAPNHPHRPG